MKLYCCGYEGDIYDNVVLQINGDLRQIDDWLSANARNINKNNFIIFGKNSQINRSTNIELNDVKINRIKSASFLGLIVNEKLNWHLHIDHIRLRIKPYVFAIRRWLVSQETSWENIFFIHISSPRLFE